MEGGKEDIGRLPLESLTTRKKKRSRKKSKKKKKTPTTLKSLDGGPPQHQLIFEDSFQWNRKNYDLPKKKTKEQVEIARLEKEEKRRRQTAVNPADKAEALEVQIQAMREKQEERERTERKKTSASLRSIALMTKRAREAEALLKSAFSGQNSMVTAPTSSLRPTSEGGGSAEYLDLSFRFKQLEKENKRLKSTLNEAEKRELDMLDEASVESRSLSSRVCRLGHES
jgi:hypothetical protein